MMEWKPIETAPHGKEFLAETYYGDWLKVERYDDPFNQDESAVIHRLSGKLWYAIRWMPLPPPPKTEG